MRSELRKLLVIGLDGATFALLDPLIERGVLPNLAELIGGGFCGVVNSTVPPVSAPAWTSFMTGKNPGKHGVYNFITVNPCAEQTGTLREAFPGGFTVLNSRHIVGRTLWEVLSEAGKRVVVINVPMTYPPRAVNGVMITGMLTPPGASDFTYPPDLADKLPGYEIGLDDRQQRVRREEYCRESFLRGLREVTSKRGETALRLMAETEHDFFMVVFTGTDRLQHRFWKSLDPTDPEHSIPWRQPYRDLCEAYFRQLDDFVGRLRSAAGPNAITVVVSDHGFGPSPSKRVYRGSLLEYLGLGPGVGTNPAGRLLAALERVGIDGPRVNEALGRLVPRTWLYKASRALKRQAWQKNLAGLGLMTQSIGGIWISPAGEDDSGGLHRADDRQDLLARLATRLECLRDELTGELVVNRVHRREELYHGAQAHKAPDLIFILKPDYKLATGVGPIGDPDARGSARQVQEGSHREEGVLLMAGPGVRHVRAEQAARLEDLAPTILHLMGLAVPADMDGRVLSEALSRDLMEGVQVTSELPQDAGGGTDGGGSTVWESPEDEEAILNRLRGIGYLD